MLRGQVVFTLIIPEDPERELQLRFQLTIKLNLMHIQCQMHWLWLTWVTWVLEHRIQPHFYKSQPRTEHH